MNRDKIVERLVKVGCSPHSKEFYNEVEELIEDERILTEARCEAITGKKAKEIALAFAFKMGPSYDLVEEAGKIYQWLIKE